MTSTIQPFPAGTIEHVAKSIAERCSGSELTRLAAEVPLRDDPGEGQTKWRRLAHAVSANQQKTQTGNALVRLVTVAMRPDRTLDRKQQAESTRDHLNQALWLVGLKVRADARVSTTPKAHTDTEALARSHRLRNLLVERDAHPEVIACCCEDLVRTDYYEAVFEAIKGLGSRIRELTGVDADGYSLIEQTMAGKEPIRRINDGETTTQRSEQLGLANLAQGLFSAFRDPAAHEPELLWTMSEMDALHVLGTLSLIHRRLDAAFLEPRP